jgi:hypothetical protein
LHPFSESPKGSLQIIEIAAGTLQPAYIVAHFIEFILRNAITELLIASLPGKHNT